MENYTENFLSWNRSILSKKQLVCWEDKKKKKKAISKGWRRKICCISYKMILANFNISIQTRNRVILGAIQCDYMADYRE